VVSEVWFRRRAIRGIRSRLRALLSPDKRLERQPTMDRKIWMAMRGILDRRQILSSLPNERASEIEI
jgi:hypothetical protein